MHATVPCARRLSRWQARGFVLRGGIWRLNLCILIRFRGISEEGPAPGPGWAVEPNIEPVEGSLTDHQEERLPCQGHPDGQGPLETTRLTGRAERTQPCPSRPRRSGSLDASSWGLSGR